jgi:hypothetical protein
VVTELPRNTLGTPLRLSRGTRVTLSFITKGSSGFSVDAHVNGTTKLNNETGLQLTHTGKTKALAKRKSRRRQVDIRCEFYFVNVQETGTGRKKVSKLVVDNRRFTGSVKDISVGGCALETNAPIQPGSRLKLNIDYDNASLITVLGQVIRTNKSGLSGMIIHMKFLKVPRRAYNSISALVFRYDEN